MYFITTIDDKNEACRCVGYVSTLKKAINIVKNNQYDLAEAGTYPYAVIEHVTEGVYQYDPNPLWFEYNKKEKKYNETTRPKAIPTWQVGFGIG